MKLGTLVNYDGERKYIGKRILKNQSANTFRLLGDSFTVYMFKRSDGHIVTVAQNVFDRLNAAQHHAHLTPESLASSQAVVNASALEQSDGDSSPAPAQVTQTVSQPPAGKGV